MPVLQWFKDQLKNKIIPKSSTSCLSSWKLVSLGLRLLALNLSTGSQYELTKTHHSLPWWASYGVSFVSISEKDDDHVTKRFYCMKEKIEPSWARIQLYRAHDLKIPSRYRIQFLLPPDVLPLNIFVKLPTVSKIREIFTGPTYKLILSFTVISDVYRSFIPNKTTFTKYCLTQWISKLCSFEIHLVREYLANFMGLAGTGFPQKSQKKVPWFSMTSPGQNPNFHTKIPIFVFAAHVSICRINYRQTQTHHSHTQTHTWFGQGQPTIQLILLVIELIQEVKTTLVNLIKMGNRFSY